MSGRETRGRAVAIADLAPRQRDDMFRLLDLHFADADRETFERDLAEKDAVILLEDREGGVVGFSTYDARVRPTSDGDALVIYSGDTIVRADHRRQTDLHRIFATEALGVAEASPLPAWWLLICSGYKTYRFLPLFLREYHPGGPCEGPLRTIADALAADRFGDRYDPRTGIVSVPGASRLRAGVADVDARRLADPVVRTFCTLNPGHSRGDELVCLARIARDNLTAAAERMLRAGAR